MKPESPTLETAAGPRGAWVCLRERTRDEWLDINRHINVRHYLHMASNATRTLMDEALRAPGDRAEPASFFTYEARMFYKRELLENQQIAAYVHPVSHDGRKLKAVIRIERIDPDPVLAAECEWTGAFVDPKTNDELKLSDYAVAEIEAKIAEGPIEYERRPYVPFLTMPPNEAMRHTIEKTIKPEWARRGDAFDFGSYPNMFFDSFQAQQFQAMGLEFNDLRKAGLTMFVLELSIQSFTQLRVGDAYRMDSVLDSIGRKTLRMRHDVYSLEGEPRLAATGWFTRAIVDYNSRKTVAIPLEMRETIERNYGVVVPDPAK